MYCSEIAHLSHLSFIITSWIQYGGPHAKESASLLLTVHLPLQVSTSNGTKRLTRICMGKSMRANCEWKINKSNLKVKFESFNQRPSVTFLLMKLF